MQKLFITLGVLFFASLISLAAAGLTYRHKQPGSPELQRRFDALWSEAIPLITNVSPSRTDVVVEVATSDVPVEDLEHRQIAMQEGFIEIGLPAHSVWFELHGWLVLQAILYQTGNGRHTGPEWFEGRIVAEAYAIAAQLRKANPNGNFRFAEQRLGLLNVGLTNLMGPQVMRANLTPFTKVQNQYRWVPSPGSDLVNNRYAENGLVQMWELLESASGKQDFWTLLNTAVNGLPVVSEAAILQILDSLVPAVDGQKASAWVMGYPVIQNRKAGEFLGVTMGNNEVEFPYTIRSINGLELFPNYRTSPSVTVAVENFNDLAERAPLYAPANQFSPRREFFGFWPNEKFLLFGIDGLLYETGRIFRTKAVAFFVQKSNEILVATNYWIIPSSLTNNFIFAQVDPKRQLSSLLPGKTSEQRILGNAAVVNGVPYTVIDPRVRQDLRIIVDREVDYYLPVVGTFQGLAVTNLTDDEGQAVKLRAFDKTGRLLGTATQVVGPKQQLAKLVPEWFASPIAQAAYLVVTAPREDWKVFTVFGDSLGLDGGSVAFRPGKDFVFLQGRALREIYLLNPGVALNDARVEYYDRGGILLFSVPKILRAGAVETVAVESLANLAYVRVRSSNDVFVSAVTSISGRDFSYLEGQDVAAPVSSTGGQKGEAPPPVFPHFAVGDGWQSVARIVNLGPEQIQLAFEARNDAGALLPEVAQNPVSWVIKPGELAELDIRELFQITGNAAVSGGVRIRAETWAPKFHATMSFSRPGKEEAVLAVPRYSSHDLSFNQIATTAGYFTGVAIGNVLGRKVDVIIEAYDRKGGTRIGFAKFQLPPYGRKVAMIDELTPEARGQAAGFIRVGCLPEQVFDTDQDLVQPEGPPCGGFALYGNFATGAMAAVPGQPQ